MLETKEKKIVEYKNAKYYFADKEDYDYIVSLICELELSEPFDWQSKIIIFEYKGEKSGVCAFRYQPTDKGDMPRLEHILLSPKVRRSRLALMLLIQMERYFKKQGHTQYLAYIKKDNERMRQYASHWGMFAYLEDNDGVWYYKNI